MRNVPLALPTSRGWVPSESCALHVGTRLGSPRLSVVMFDPRPAE